MLCCSIYKCNFLTNEASNWGKKQAFWLYKIYYQETLLQKYKNKEINQAQVFLLSVLSL